MRALKLEIHSVDAVTRDVFYIISYLCVVCSLFSSDLEGSHTQWTRQAT